MKTINFNNATVGEFRTEELEIQVSKEFGDVPYENISKFNRIFTDGNIISDPEDRSLDPRSIVSDFSYLVYGDLEKEQTTLHVVLAPNVSVDILSKVPIFTEKIIEAIAS